MEWIRTIGIVGLLFFIMYGCRKDNKKVNPNIKLTARFDVSVDFLTVSFTNKTIIPIGGDQPSYAWDFGDGNTSTQIAPSHTYSEEGTYIVTLTANEGGDASEASDTLKVKKIPNSITSNFDYSVNDLEVEFTNQTEFQGVDPTYKWEFGDGETSTDSDPTHSYDNYGTYVVKLIANQPDKKDTLIDTLKITPPPIATGLISIDGDFSDWDNIPVSSSNNTGDLSLLKTYYKDGMLYVYVEGDDNVIDFDNNIYHLFFNSDGNAGTGLSQWTYGAGSGAEYYYEGNLTDWGNLFQFIGNSADIDDGQEIVDQDDDDMGIQVQSGDVGGGNKAMEFSFKIGHYLTSDEFGFAIELMNSGYAIIGSLPEDQHTNSKFLMIDTSSTAGEQSTISIDGNFSDWDNIASVATNNNGSLSLLKTVAKDNILYVYLEGSSDLDDGHVYDIFMNTDNNDQTGFQYWQYPAGSGADYYYEGNLFGWGNTYTLSDGSDIDNVQTEVGDQDDDDIGLTVSPVGSNEGHNALELSIDLNKWNVTGSKITFAIVELDPNSYNSIGSLPKASTDNNVDNNATFVTVDIQ